jgi:uncharacterized membrane protein
LGRVAKASDYVTLGGGNLKTQLWRLHWNADTILNVIVIVVLIGGLLIFRLTGVFGVATFATWVASARWALAAMFLFTGVAHFTKTKYSMARMVPRIFGNAMAMVYFTGACEMAGAIGLLLPRFRSAAGIGLVALLVAMFPANAKAAKEKMMVAGRPATALWLRLPMQLAFIALAWWVSRP